MATRGSYVNNSMVEFSGHPENVSFMQFSQKIDGFRQKIHRAIRTHVYNKIL